MFYNESRNCLHDFASCACVVSPFLFYIIRSYDDENRNICDNFALNCGNYFFYAERDIYFIKIFINYIFLMK